MYYHYHAIISPQLSNAEHKPPLEITKLLGPLLSSSSAHRRFYEGHRTNGSEVVSRYAYRDAVYLAIGPTTDMAYCHFLILSARETPSIARSRPFCGLAPPSVSASRLHTLSLHTSSLVGRNGK